jgi:CubicO group peptidase (beta-lactamase class C family)
MVTTVALLYLNCVAPAIAADSASYRGLKPDQFMRRWLVLKPIPAPNKEGAPDEAVQEQAFAWDLLAAQGGEARLHPHSGLKVKAGDSELEWRLVVADNDIVDLEMGSNAPDSAEAYAWAEIDMPARRKGLLGIGSTDAVKVWLNGKLVHENLAARPVEPDQDLAPVEFKRGKNQLLLKLRHTRGASAFCCHILGKAAQANKLISAIFNDGDPASLQKLLSEGVDVNSRGKSGVTAYQVALLHGESELARFLADHGARTNARMPPAEHIVETLFGANIGANAPGAAVLVAQNGRVLFKKGYGLADVPHGIPITPRTQFCIGSITKQFIAAAILKLEEEGKLSVTDKLSKYFPDFPRGDEVTLRHLLTHTSGIHSYSEKPGFADRVTNSLSPDAVIESFRNDPHDFNPGEKWRYDNSGYFLLGRIIEKVSGKPHGDWLHREFFEPLGMAGTGVHCSGAVLKQEAIGYQFDSGKFSNAPNWDLSWFLGSGDLYSTVEDLCRWNEGVFATKVLGAASLKRAWSPVRTEENRDDSSDTGYGYGWALSRFRGDQEISHSGGIPGFSSFLLLLPRENFTVVVLANSQPGSPAAEPGRLAHLVAEVYLGQKLAPRPSREVNHSVSAESFDALAGRYDYGDLILTVTREGDHLFAQLGPGPKSEIFATSETEFFWKAGDAQITFVKDKSGKVVKAIHHQNGQNLYAPRLEELAGAKIDPAGYDSLPGKYDYGEGKEILTVTREGGRLYAQLTGQPKCEIFPKSPTEFFWKDADARVEFVKDEKGKVVKAVTHQGGKNCEAQKLSD